MTSPIWRPDPARVASSNLLRFLKFVKARAAAPPASLGELHAWSVRSPEDFWGAVSDFSEIRFTSPPTSIVEDAPDESATEAILTNQKPHTRPTV